MFLAIRVRGTLDLPSSTTKTLNQIGLNKPHTAGLFPETKAYKGRLKNVKDAIAFGTVDNDTAVKFIKQAGGVQLENTKFNTVSELVTALDNRDITIGELREADSKPVFNLSPPSKGYADTKRQYGQGGSLGNWETEITTLVNRMI